MGTTRGWEDWLNTRIARFETRKYDFWSSKQITIRSIAVHKCVYGCNRCCEWRQHCTSRKLSTMVLPAQCEGPLHIHHEKFSLCSAAKLICSLSITIWNPFKRAWPDFNSTGNLLFNPGQEDALMCVMLGTEPFRTIHQSIHCLKSNVNWSEWKEKVKNDDTHWKVSPVKTITAQGQQQAYREAASTLCCCTALVQVLLHG